jgi:hypothetical protein
MHLIWNQQICNAFQWFNRDKLNQTEGSAEVLAHYPQPAHTQPGVTGSASAMPATPCPPLRTPHFQTADFPAFSRSR